MTSVEKTQASGAPKTLGQLSKPWQIILLVVVSFHLIAVFAEPFHFFSRSPVQSGADADLLRRFTRPYAQLMFLDHGYFFFAPNPGPGHLLRVVTDDAPLTSPPERFGVNPRDGTLIPDRSQHLPRLLYHRYLMFADFVNNRYAPPEIDRELAKDTFVLKSWTRDRSIYIDLIRSIAERVKRETNMPFARVDRLEREIPDRHSTLQQNIRISDPRWLQILPESLSQSSSQSLNQTSPEEENVNDQPSPGQGEELTVPK